ncbi:hypothetical protein BH10BAC1_BH10BAC1_06620 [soil metagenome]
MNSQKKRLVVYSLFIFSGFLGAYLFLRNKNNATEASTENKLVKKDSLVSVSLLSEFFDLENNGEAFISSDKFFSGKKSCKLSPSIEYGVSISKKMSDIPSFNNLTSISLTFKSFSGDADPDALYVLSIDDNAGKNIFWAGESIHFNSKTDWAESNVNFVLAPEYLNPDYKISIYPWNRKKKEFYVDDIRVDYIGNSVYKNDSLAQAEKTNLFFDFENNEGLSGTDNIKETTAHSGKKACDLTGGKEYGPSVNKKITDIGSVVPKKISLSLWVYPLTDNANVVLTASVVNSKNETVFWEGKSTENKKFPKNQWTKINASSFLPVEKISPADILGVGIWNKGKTNLIIDDLEIVYGDAPERRGSPSTVDATSIYEKRFVAEKNKPPFKTIYFEKQELKNKNSTALMPQDGIIPLTLENAMDNFSPNDVFLVGDFFPDKNSLDDIICIKDFGQVLFTYDPEKKEFRRLWTNGNDADSSWNNKNDYYSGDFNSDGKADVLSVDKKTNNWTILNFAEKNWKVVSQGKNPKKEWITKSETKKTEQLFPGNYFDNTPAILKLNTEWRFDLKLVQNIGGENIILGNVDFKGYAKDYNPKYYEFVKLIQGRFLSKDQTSLIVVMCNCADVNFTGEHCDEIEYLPFLPNAVQIYRIVK